ncbi:unnamed protein product [Heligmosomoides polygyrus]|uniref:Reverse transcriptase domain-containing protein n=1 Tax=Heligmosomoides polygyrus TaxID=6339 RepID=A0A183GBK9_HELPZ|nr:unnamed protein product [Heligmosomoides polygyrus]
MSSNVYTISFVLEKIHHTIDPQFDLRLRFEGHEWCSLGEVWTDDLPIGYSFTTILSSFKNAQMFTVDVGLSSSSSFLAQLQLPKQSRADVLSSRGLSVLYSDTKGDKVLAITVAVKINRYYHQPTQEFEVVLRQIETQTERTETRTVHTQVRRRCSTTGSNTELHLLSAAELEDTVTNVIAQHLRLSEHEDGPKPLKDSGRPKSTEPKDVGMSLDEKLGKNLVPRLQKLRVLDKMIGERAALVERFDASVVKQEIARKKAQILKSRTVDNLSNPVPWTLLYADDVMLASEDKDELEREVQAWCDRLERFGLKLNVKKTEYLTTDVTESSSIKVNGIELPRTSVFKYLGSAVTSDGKLMIEVNSRVSAAWSKWRSLTGVLCDRKIPERLKSKIYRAVVRPVAMYGSECWPATREVETRLSVMETKMLRWTAGVTRMDRIRNDAIRQKFGVAPITDKMREARLRWYSHVLRGKDDRVRKIGLNFEVIGKRPRGRPKQRWLDTLHADLKITGVYPDLALDRESAKETTSGSGRVLSPTSLYLKQLREKILHERMEKL